MVPAATNCLWPRLAAMHATFLLATLRHATCIRGVALGIVRCLPLRLSGVAFSVGVTGWLGYVFFRQRDALAGVRAVVGGESAGSAT